MRRTLVFSLCFCGGLAIPQSLWGQQNNCANEFANRDQLKQWVDSDRTTGKNTLEYNTAQLANAEKALKTCMKDQFGTPPSIKAMGEDGELITFPNGTCFKSRDFAKDFKAEGTVKVKELFDGHLSYEQKVGAVGQLSATTKQVEDALFLSCLDYVQGRITLQMYQDNKKAYEEVRDFKRVSKVRDISSGQINVGCNTGANAETSVLQIGKSPMNYVSGVHWANTDHIKNQTQSVIESKDGNGVLTGVKGVGHIDGEDRDWVGNCHGGGHGELVLHVEWSELVPINQ